MRTRVPHPWNVSPAAARRIQDEIRHHVSLRNGFREVRFVAGVDISIRSQQAYAAVVVLRLADLRCVELARAERPVEFPYVPGLLSFREAPSILAACEQLSTEPDLFLFDGQGFAHPRRVGLASHMGVVLGRPSIGCAKTRFIGTFDEPHEKAGSYTDLWDGQALIGAVLRTRSNVKPMFISPGHQIDFPTSIDYVLACCNGYRLPEPTRLAHLAAGGKKVLARLA